MRARGGARLKRLRLVLWAVVALWVAALAVGVAARGRISGLPVLGPGQAATAADAGVRVVVPDSGAAPVRTPTLAAIEPDGRTGSVRLGQGVELVDFFATWCHACSIDMTAMKAYSALAARRHLPPLVAVDLRVAEPSTAYVRRFAHGAGLTFPVALDATGKVTDAYHVSMLPTVVLVGRGGGVLWRHTGIVHVSALLSAVRAHPVPAG